MPNEIKSVNPIQPYLVLNSSEYYKYPLLNSPVSHFYQFSSNKKVNQVIPDGTFDLLFELDNQNPKVILAGPVTKTNISTLAKNKDYFGIRCAHGKMPSQLLSLANELLDKETELNDLIPNKNLDFLNPFFEFSLTSKELKTRINLFMKFVYPNIFAENALVSRSQSITQYVISILSEKQGNITIREISEIIGYSEKYIRNVFKLETGMTPKAFADILRFQVALEELKHTNNITAVAYDCGYYDQSHFLHAFRKYSETTPRRFVKLINDSHYEDKLNVLNRES